MRYRIKVAGKIFESDNPRVLLKRAVEARREVQKDPYMRLAVRSQAVYTQSPQSDKSEILSLC